MCSSWVVGLEQIFDRPGRFTTSSKLKRILCSSVSSAIQTPQISSKRLRCVSYVGVRISR